MVKRLSSLQTTGWGEKRDKKDRSKVYTVKGVFNYGKWIRLANPISGEKDIDVDIKEQIINRKKIRYVKTRLKRKLKN